MLSESDIPRRLADLDDLSDVHLSSLAGPAILRNLPLVGATALGIIETLGKTGIAEEGERFDSGQPNGPVLVTVKAGTRTAKVTQLLQAYGGDTGGAGHLSEGAPVTEAIKRANEPANFSREANLDGLP